MKKLSIIALAVMACSPALAATMASQPWVTNRIAETEARIADKITAATNGIPRTVLPNYWPLSAVTNADGTPVTSQNLDGMNIAGINSTAGDAWQMATDALGGLSGVAQSATNYTDAVAAEFENGTRQVENAQYAGSSSDAMCAYKVSGDNWNDQYNANELIRASTNAARAVVAPVAVAATNYTDAATNALAQTIPQGGGTPEWREVNYDAEVDVVNYVTNGIAILTFINAGYAYGINVSTNGWPEGASMFVRGSVRAGATYTIPYDFRLIGYGTWPTNNFQSVWWRSGTNIFVNILVEE